MTSRDCAGLFAVAEHLEVAPEALPLDQLTVLARVLETGQFRWESISYFVPGQTASLYFGLPGVDGKIP